MRPRIHTLRESDMTAATALAHAERWNQTTQDWRLILKHSPGCSFGASIGTRLIGTVSAIRYATTLGWIGMLVVAEDCRRAGIGRSLLQAAMKHLEESGVASIKLDATPAGQPLYRSLGFRPEATVCRWEGVGSEDIASAAPQCGSHLVTTKELYAVNAMDRSAFGVNRRKVLARLFENCNVVPVVSSNPSPARAYGYGLGRPGANACYVGPVVADNESIATWVLGNLLAQLSGKRVYLDQIAPWSSGVSLLTKRGFVKQRGLTRMGYGKASDAGVGRGIFCSAGPELG